MWAFLPVSAPEDNIDGAAQQAESKPLPLGVPILPRFGQPRQYCPLIRPVGFWDLAKTGRRNRLPS